MEGWFNFNFILILKIKNTYPNPNLFKTLILIPIFSNTTPLSNTHSKKCTFIFLFVWKKKKITYYFQIQILKSCFKKNLTFISFFLKLFILLFKGLSLFGFLIFLSSKMPPTPLCLSRDKIKRQSGKYTTLTPTKTLLKNRVTLLLIFKLLYLLIN